MQKDNTCLNGTHGPMKSTYYVYFKKSYFCVVQSTMDKISYLLMPMDDILPRTFVT